jgi:GTPase SAR1 family protein
MALCCLPADEADAARKSKRIDKQLRHERNHYRKLVKILLLGAGESGKSTFLRQIRIIHGQDFDETARLEFCPIMYGNVLKWMRVLLEARRRLSIPWADAACESRASALYQYNNEQLDSEAFAQYVPVVNQIWSDDGIQKTFARRSEYQIGDSLEYFISRLDAMSQPDYTPNRQDILRSRKATRGICEYNFEVKGVPFLMVDVGGQRSQRTKWFQCFDEVTSIIFLVASSAFDQTLMEDRSTNRMVESLNIFDTIVNNKCFRHVSIILFLNKTDLLEEKVKTADISKLCSSFRGDPHDLDHVQQFILGQFVEKRNDPNKQIYHHFTTATDTENIRVVFRAVKDTILSKNIQTLMLQ